jgi:hypothetical protein
MKEERTKANEVLVLVLNYDVFCGKKVASPQRTSSMMMMTMTMILVVVLVD